MSQQVTQEALMLLMSMMDQLQGKLVSDKHGDAANPMPGSVSDEQEPAMEAKKELADPSLEASEPKQEPAADEVTRDYIRSKLGIHKPQGKTIEVGMIGIAKKPTGMSKPAGQKNATGKPFKAGK